MVAGSETRLNPGGMVSYALAAVTPAARAERDDVIKALSQFRDYGESSLCTTPGCSTAVCGRHHGMLAGAGWSASVLRQHIEDLRSGR